MKNFIKAIDVFGGDVTLYYKGKSGVRTVFGGLITILVGFILILLIIGFGQNFYKRINPLLLIQDLNPNYYNRYNISNTNFPISFRYENSDGKLLEIEEKSFKFDIVHERYIRQDGSLELLLKENLPYKQCIKSEFSNDYLYDKFGLNKSLCFDYGEKGYHEFGGFWDGDFVDLIYFNFIKCKEGTINNKGLSCASEEETQTLISSLLYVSIFVPNILIDPSNYTSPFISTLTNLYSMIDSSIVKNTFHRFIEVQMISDIGWVIEDIKELKEISYFQTTVDYSLLSSFVNDIYYSNCYGSINLYMVKSIKKYTRVYSKIQNLAAEVGGILKLFTLSMSILIQFYNNSFFEYEIMKLLDKYLTNTQDKSNKINIPAKAQSVSNLTNLNQSSFLNMNRSHIKVASPFKSKSNTEELNLRLQQIENNIIIVKRIQDELNRKHSFRENGGRLGLPLKRYILNKLCIFSKSDEKDYTKLLKNNIIEYLDIESILISVIKQKRLNQVLFEKEENSFYLK